MVKKTGLKYLKYVLEHPYSYTGQIARNFNVPHGQAKMNLLRLQERSYIKSKKTINRKFWVVRPQKIERINALLKEEFPDDFSY